MNDQNMLDMKRFIELYAACTRAMVRATAMQARNMDNITKKKGGVSYLEEDFTKVIEEEGVGYNEVIGKLYHS